MSKSSIEEFIFQKQGWIFGKLAEFDRNGEITHYNFVDGEIFNFMGEKYVLQITRTDKKRTNVKVHKNILSVTTLANNSIQIKNAIIKWYREQAFEYLSKTTHQYYIQFKNKAKHELIEVKIRTYKRKWGSTSSKGTITFNWKLMMAPKNIIDYVIIHELTHLIHMNHSKLFWNELHKYYPDYKMARNWLKSNGYLLEIA